MKIAFICGSSEPGKDGVGDYTRRLAAELICQQHKVCIIALADKFISSHILMNQEADNQQVPVCRIPFSSSKLERIAYAKEIINDFDPSFLSLQYVPFSFHTKGIPFLLENTLASIGDGRQWHIMFHELWVGMSSAATVKHVILGSIQKKLIKSMVGKLKPALIHTQSKLYQIQLQNVGIPARSLPLFSNIPRSTYKQKANKRAVSFVLFGSIHPGAPVKEFVNEAFNFSRQNGREIEFTIVGRSGPLQVDWQEACTKNDIPIAVLGDQPPEEISYILSNASFGISTSSLPYIEKSGSVAAMRTHQLPVICVAAPIFIKGFNPTNQLKGIREYIPGNLEELLQENSNTEYQGSLTQVAEEFLKAINTGN